MLNADPAKVSLRAKKRGLPQVDMLKKLSEFFQVIRPLVRNVGCWQSLRRNTSGGRNLRQVVRKQNGHRTQGPSLYHDTLRKPRVWSPSRHRYV